MVKKVLKKAKDGKELSEVKVRPGFGQNFKSNMKNFMSTDSTDYQNTPAKTTAGKVLRGANKVASVAARVAGSPVTTALSAADAGVKSVQNAVKARKELKAIPEKKAGGMIKRADGSYSKRGLWDNIRANKGSGKKPTAAMLKQEKKIKAQTKKK
jgi:hypothetical protein